LSSTPRVFCSTGGRRSRCSRNPVQVSSRLRCGGPIGALNAAWRIGCQPQRRLAKWRAQRREAIDEVESRLRCGGASIHRKCAHLDRRLLSWRWGLAFTGRSS